MAGSKIMSLEDVYKRELAELQSANHKLMIRIKELSEEINKLRKRIEKK